MFFLFANLPRVEKFNFKKYKIEHNAKIYNNTKKYKKLTTTLALRWCCWNEGKC